MDTLAKILIVDDTPSNIVAMKSILKHSGAELHDVESGNAALSMMLRHDYAVVLVDVQMPGMDGFELVNLMRQNPSTETTPAIFVTANNKAYEDIKQGYEVGAVDYMFKPVDKKILVKKVKVFIDLYIQRMTLKDEMEKYKKYMDKPSADTKHVVGKVEQSHVLIVDDRDENLFSMERILKKLPVIVHTANSGEKALKEVEKQNFAVILLDVQMPGMDGFEVAEQLVTLTEFSQTPIIFVTAINRDDEHVMRGYQSGAVDYLFKPIDPETLLSKVDVFVTLHQQRLTLDNLLNEKEGLIENIKEKNSELGYLAYHDSLTEIPNRQGFETAIAKAVYTSRRYDRIFALLFIDIDHFKTINDTYGHEYGDELLRHVANKLKSVVRQSDYVARLGGDEFGLILDEVKASSGASAVANKIIETLSETVAINDKEFKVSVSIGITYFPGDDKEGDKQLSDDELVKRLVRNADVAMYRVKKDGRGSYQYFTEEFSEQHQRQLMIESALGFAIENNEFYLVFQPKFYLETKKMAGVEALLRWEHPEHGYISPGDFIPIAEESNVIIALGAWVLEESCKQLAAWRELGVLDLKIAINVSTKQLVDEGFSGRVQRYLKEYDISADLIELEITETAVMGDTSTVFKTIESLHDLGVAFTVDDFGTGCSVLSHLKRLPIQGLKIDIDFIRDVTTNQSDAMITNAIIGLADNLYLSVVAEGIETEEQLAYLIERGCEMGQGYLYSKPLKPEELLEFINKHNPKPNKQLGSSSSINI